MQSQHHVNASATISIPTTRYIELLELEIRSLKGRAPAADTCTMNEITKRIRATGITVQQWAENHCFPYSSVRNAICGREEYRSIRDALAADGFMDQQP